MTKITHPDMSRGRDVPSNQTQTENFIVDDLSNGQAIPSQIDARMAAFMEQQPQPQAKEEIKMEVIKTQQLVDTQTEAQKKLEKLIFIGRNIKEVMIAGHKFELSTLTHRENNEVMAKLMTIGETADLFTVRVLTLGQALKSIDDEKIDIFPIEGEFESAYQRRVAIIDSLQAALVEKLFDAYENLLKETESSIYGDAIKNL
jgi:hypothetical protein